MVLQEQDTGAQRTSVLGPSVRRACAVIIFSALVAAGLGYLITRFQPTAYEAQARLVLSSSGNFDPLVQNIPNDPGRFLLNQIEIINSSPVLAPAAVGLAQPTTEEELSQSLDVTASSDSDVITIKATATTAADAAARANSVAQAYRSFNAEAVSARAAAAIAETTQPEEISAIQTAAAVYGDGVAVAEPAVLPTDPAEPQPLRNAALLGLLAAFATLGVLRYRGAFKNATERLNLSDRAVRTLANVTVPHYGGDDAVALAYRRNVNDLIGTLLVLDAFRQRVGTVLVTGTKRGVGTSGATLQLALAAASQGRRVVIIESNGRGENLFTGSDGRLRLFWRAAADRTGREPLHRLADDTVDPSRVVRICTVAGQNLGLVTATVDDLSRGLMALRSQLSAIERLAQLADLILIDAPPALITPAGLRMLPVAEAVLLVTDRAGNPDVGLITVAVEAVGSVCAGLLVVNRDIGVARPAKSLGSARADGAADVSTVTTDPPTESPASSPLHASWKPTVETRMERVHRE